MENSDITKTSTQILELKDLISGPLIATIDADFMASQRYLDYLYQVAFESYDKESGKVGKMRLFKFTYTDNKSGESKEQQITIPLLTLVPLPLLQVKEADFAFDIQILDAYEEKTAETFSLKDGCLMNTDEAPDEDPEMKFRVALAPSSRAYTENADLGQGLNANMNVKVKMRQADMPGGLSNLLSLTSRSVSIEETDKK